MTEQRALIIDNQPTPAASGRSTPDTNPYTGEVFTTVAAAAESDVTAAVDAAERAGRDWADTSPSRRRDILWRAADTLASRAEQAIELMATETGATAGWAGFNAELGAAMLREAAASATRPIGEVLATDAPGVMSLSVREPAGVVAAFAPWNAPLILGCRAIAAPLAAGNTVVLKASEKAPVASGLFIAEALIDAGLPPGVLNVISNDPADAADVAATLVGDRRVRRVNFTGSTMAGRRIAALAAESLTPAVLELGGKNALLVLDDADLDYAARAVTFSAYFNSGQICMSADRVVAHRSIAAELTERIAARAANLSCGDPGDPANALGPLIDTDAAARVASLVDGAVRQGAALAAGGGTPDGACYPATVVTGVTEDMPLHNEEIFGPVCTVLPVDSDAEAVALANASPYGLTAGVLTENLSRGWEVARGLRTGIVHVNDQSIDDEPQAPFGGVKDSGHGRFGGRHGIEAFSETRWITLRGRHKQFPI
ncbi:aldehyde dehydrogenase family protein [Stackebrandtia nassauensis]|uniref:Aldehyde Dehydrogenase n=1 Tax=Stackebrandtia nassauensis (strain DSM 44728 / CIP 108903 / NRRL B-16338 / NBRC 102104 / LLR-40K-21) TaxID=446470 RepID=D3Q3H5_STANL|nr:aldehyde dehydrogenase family protein [Stackebrandtia nassauensis]ADD42016.1 Aldehyde Dehydrogenase [Stackebrandtia nassauensis DSM 44728]